MKRTVWAWTWSWKLHRKVAPFKEEIRLRNVSNEFDPFSRGRNTDLPLLKEIKHRADF